MDLSGVNVIQGDALDMVDVLRAMDGQDVLLCSLEGDVLTMANNIAAALEETSVKRIIWITGMGIHREIKGIHGMMLNQLAKKMPEYITAADTIAASSAVTTLLRCPGIRDGEGETYRLTREGETPACWVVDRAAIAQCMAEIVHRYEGVSERMGYQIHLTLDEPCMVRCDESKIDRVIGNLINNAINYTSKEDKQVFVTQRNLPQCVRIEVRDTGDGIEEDKIKLIFDKYYRSENHKREVVGTGLGLSIVKEILKMHNYNYGVNSKLGEGSTFWFEIRDIVPPEKPEDEEIPDAEIRQL